jgi:hypothetical protein
MDPRLNLAMIEQQDAEVRRRADAERARRRWPDDGQPPRTDCDSRRAALHPTAILASILTERC